MSSHGCGSVVRRGSSAVVLALAIIASPAIAQKADRPAVKVGDEWQFIEYFGVPPAKPNQHWVVTSVKPTAIEGTANGQPLLLTPDLNIVDSPRFRHSDFRMLSFPLELGKQWSCSSNSYNVMNEFKFTADYVVSVVANERVRVPAGEFDAFRLEARGKFGIDGPPGPGASEETRTYWYAPAARAIVKEEVRNPTRGAYTVELVSFKLQP